MSRHVVTLEFTIAADGVACERIDPPSADSPVLSLLGDRIAFLPASPVQSSMRAVVASEVEISESPEDFSIPLLRQIVLAGAEAPIPTGLPADGGVYHARQRDYTIAGASPWSAVSAPLRAELLRLDFAAGDFVVAGATLPTLAAAQAAGAVGFARPSAAALVDARGEVARFAAGAPAVLSGIGLSVFDRELRNRLPAPLDAPPPADRLPQGWALANSSDAVVTVAASGVEAGLSHVDLRITGVAKAGVLQILLHDDRALAASVGEVWTASACVRLIAGSADRFSYAQIRCVELANAKVRASSDARLALAAGGLWAARVFATRSCADPAITHAGARLAFGVPAGPIDVTLRVAQPQMERASAPSPAPILSDARAADRLSLRLSAPFEGVLVVSASGRADEIRAWSGVEAPVAARVDEAPISALRLLPSRGRAFDPADARLSWSRP